MGTLPVSSGGLEGFQLAEQPGRTYRLELDRERVSGMTDGREAVLQAVYLILNVERYVYPIYSRDYGAELTDLIGRPAGYAMSEIKRRITEALEQDDRILGVENWAFEVNRNRVRASFTVHTLYGEVEAAKEVEI